jgi:RNA polymerase sigma factor (sigma-70 family)
MSTIAQLIRQFGDASSPTDKLRIANMLFHAANLSALKHCAGKKRHAQALHDYRNLVYRVHVAVEGVRNISPMELDLLEHYCLLACLEASRRSHKRTPRNEPTLGVESLPSEEENPIARLIWSYRLQPDRKKWIDLSEVIVDAMRPKLLRFIRAFCSPQIAEDVLHDTLLTIILRLWWFEGKSDRQFQAYCYAIAKGYIAEVGVGPTLSDDLEDFEAACDALAQDKFESDEHRAQVRSAVGVLRVLNKRSRAFVWLHCARDVPIKEIARRYGLKYDAVQKDIYRSLKRLRSLPRKEY